MTLQENAYFLCAQLGALAPSPRAFLSAYKFKSQSRKLTNQMKGNGMGNKKVEWEWFG